jgi:SAM-dependent methyltransferase
MSLYLGIFLVTLSGLMFEIGLTRIFSATIWYHFAFVAISVALLGWGLGGFALHLARGRVTLSRERSALLTFLYGLSIPLALWLIVRVPFHPDRLSFYFAVSLLPFLLAGMALSMLFAIERHNAGRLYFADLLGASLGALTITFLLSWLGGENAVLLVAIAPFLAAGAFARRFRVLSAVALLAILVALAVNLRTGFFNIHSAPTKGLYRHMAAAPGSKIELTGWNAYSRIDAVTGLDPSLLARLYIDSDAWTNVLPWDGRLDSLAELRDWYRAIPFKMAPPRARTLIIGPGGGSDVLVALAAGSEKVTAVEMNPLMLRFARHFGARAGNLYDHPQVETILSEGRTFIRRSDRRFDVILLGFVDSWAAVASGGLSLSENHLYTVEALQSYYDHLTPGGQIAILRWTVDIPRLVSNAIAMLGREEAGRRVAVLLESRDGNREDPPQMIFMLKKTPFSPEERERLASFSGVSPVIVPGGHVAEPYASLFAGRMSFAEYEAQATSRVDPVFDDRPFFFARAKPWGLPRSMEKGLQQILAPILALCVLFLVLGKPKREPVAPYSASIVYFASLGVGFIAVELTLLQHLTLLLGHPIFTLSILLFTLLASGGFGSALGGRPSLRSVCLAVAGLAAVYALSFPRVIPALLPLPLAARIAIAIAIVAPLGFLMGMPFPRALQRTGQGPFPAPPFYWGLNGIFSVVGSMATMGASVVFGFTWAMLGGAAFYLVAALASRTFARTT